MRWGDVSVRRYVITPSRALFRWHSQSSHLVPTTSLLSWRIQSASMEHFPQQGIMSPVRECFQWKDLSGKRSKHLAVIENCSANRLWSRGTELLKCSGDNIVAENMGFILTWVSPNLRRSVSLSRKG